MTVLDRILERKREEVAALRAGPGRAELAARAARAETPRGFARALVAGPSPRVVAEFKRASPSRGEIRPGADPAAIARDYAASGAAALSVLTDREFFGGSAHDLMEARTVTKLPVLRKDFTVSEHDVCDARLMDADAVLLIAAALSADELGRYHQLAVDVGLDALVEIHDERELERAVDVGATMIGVNQRDLVTFAVDHERALRMASLIPSSAVKIAESGVRHAADALALRDAGYDAVLVGETLVTSADPYRTIQELKGEL